MCTKINFSVEKNDKITGRSSDFSCGFKKRDEKLTKGTAEQSIFTVKQHKKFSHIAIALTSIGIIDKTKVWK